MLGRLGKLVLLGCIIDTNYAFRAGIVSGARFLTAASASGFGDRPKESTTKESIATAATALMMGGGKDQQHQPTRSFENLQFPLEFMIKVIGEKDDTFAADQVNILATILDLDLEKPESIKVSTASKGNKYISVSLMATYYSPDALYRAYDALGKDRRVKFLI
jgi:putative lipoic acid-binding regulatory protein